MTDDEFVRLVQSRLGVVSDGVVGPKTLAALNEALPPPPVAAGWDARSAKSLEGVHADLVKVMNLARDKGAKFIVIEGLRSLERQRQLVAMGASQTMNSRHLTGHAVDVVPVDSNGKISWDWPLYHIIAPIIKSAAEELDIPVKWGGDWVSFKDGPHWELSRSKYP